ncbi:MAG: NUDIX hydrolase [Bacteroidales bacterium]|nr:NUDIX hydrolase [Bacteroidales bacterium]MBN2818333.1 NUDIX hydrolase [Bacteroidales bacterium]
MLHSEYKLAPKHLISVDCIIFGYDKEELQLLLFNRKIEPQKGRWSLLGGWVNEEESVEDAARRVLKTITGLDDIYMEQVSAFSKPERDPGGRVVSVAFYALIRINEHDIQLVIKNGATWISLNKVPELIFDHNEMLNNALEKLRLKASYEVIGNQLLPESFTILQLRKLYDAIFQKKFDPGNFRKKILSFKVLEKMNKKNMKDSKKGAFYYRFKSNAKKSGLIPVVKTF